MSLGIPKASIEKNWVLPPKQAEKVAALHAVLPKVSPTICTILVNRGIETFEQAKDFFRPQKHLIHDPFLMKDMEKAVDRILYAIQHQQKILVYGDYDVDGITSIALTYSYLKSCHTGPLEFYVPHRYKEGYGISKQGMDYAIDHHFDLIIALDCGIKSVELAAYVQSHGVDLIICDHHLPGDELPPSFAILNPKQPHCNYPYKELSGCGIGYKLICGIAQKLHPTIDKTSRFLELVAISIAADIVPMDGENRVLAYFGLEVLNDTPSAPVATLKKFANLNNKVVISDLVFAIGPIVNAAGRMDDARHAVALFLESDEAKLIEIANLLKINNELRRHEDKNTTLEALELIKQWPTAPYQRTTVVYQSHWHKGVVGIVASRLIDYYYRPTIVLTESNGKISGSARSIVGINIYEAISQCDDLLETYGGHYFAAGLTLPEQNLQAFLQRFEEAVSQMADEQCFTPKINIDAEIHLSMVNPGFLKILDQFEPFGPQNLKPIFVSRRVKPYRDQTKVVKDAHIRFGVYQEGIPNVCGPSPIWFGIGFNLADKFDIIETGLFDMVYTLEKNYYKGQESYQLRVLDIQASS